MAANDDPQSDPPSAANVASRALILKFQSAYVLTAPPADLLEATMAAWSREDRERFAEELEAQRRGFIETLEDAGLWDDVSPSERVLFGTPAMELQQQQVIDTSWRAESVACLVWALGLLDEIPAYDVQADPEAVMALVDSGHCVAFVAGAELRPRDEIERARSVAELWHWRSRTRQLEAEGFPPTSGQPTLDEIVRMVAPTAAADGAIPPPVDGDFAAFGKAYRDLSPEEWSLAQSIAMERHLALNWLCGYAPGNAWDETPTDT